MGDNTLNSVIQGTAGDVDQVNQYKTALAGDILPRNTQGTVEDEAGGLGITANRFGSIRAKNIVVDNIKENERLTFFQDIFLLADGAKEIEIQDADGVYRLNVEAWGTGGTGAAFSTPSLAGAGGGGGGYFQAEVNVESLDTINIDFTSGTNVELDSGGTVETIGNAGSGGNGQYSVSGAAYTIKGGIGGQAVANLSKNVTRKHTEFGGAGETVSFDDGPNVFAARAGVRGGISGSIGTGYNGSQNGAVVISYFAAQRLTAV